MAAVIDTKNKFNKFNPRIQSICWSCRNAWPLKCNWIARKERVWQKALEKTFCGTNGKKYAAYVVQECKFFEEE